MSFSLVKPAFAATNPILGNVTVPSSVITSPSQVGPFFSMVIRLIIVVAGIWALLQFILAGFGYVTAGGDSKKAQESFQKITYSIIGLIVIAVSFILVTILSRLLFGGSFDILNPTLQTL